MKRIFCLLSAGVFGATALLAAACASEETPLKPDEETPAFADADVTISVGGAETGADGAISDELFGVFLEDINYASQALDDNMVENGSFEQDKGTAFSGATFSETYGWTASGAAITVLKDANGVMGESYKDYQNRYNLSYASVAATAGGTLTNEGYVPVPIAVEEGTDYVFSAFMKSSAETTVTVSVTDGTTVFATVAIPVSGGWKKYERTVTATGTKAEGLKLELKFSAAATVCLDAVSFETTDSTVGIKNYLYNAVKELEPKFVRFPGGCITEGENYDQTYDWKNSIGAVASAANAGDDTVPALTYTLNTESGEREETTYGEFVTRKANVNLWQNNGNEYYPMDYGIGFYEYFLLCESLHASALPVVSCGKNCQGQSDGASLQGRHGKYVADYIRDAADLIEFAKGDTSTKWGKIRADMGHEAPFEMNYLGIGNEQWDDYFTAYYEKFLEDDYFMGKCEQYGVQLIVGNHQELVHCEGSLDFSTDTPTPRTSGIAKDAALAYMGEGKITSLGEYGVQDHHYYNSPVDFFLHAHMYDNYTRTGANRYEVFVGEYSANNTHMVTGNFSNLYAVNNWFSALSEAAMMTGFERNGDIVKLAAYAPMFAPVDAGLRHWQVDMMLFTNTELVRTANYYVQQLFMQDAGTRKLQSTVSWKEGLKNEMKLRDITDRAVTAESLYYVASLDEATGDYIVKIVNAGTEDLRVNVSLGSAALTGIADVNELLAPRDAVNTLEKESLYSYRKTIGAFTDGTAGYELLGGSVVSLRFHTK